MTISGLVVLALGGVFAIRSFGSDGGDDSGLGAENCDKPISVTVGVTPDLQPALDAAAKSLEGRDDGGACANFKVTAQSSAEVASLVAGDDKSRPDLWIPDSSLWIARADDGQSLPAVAVPSLATTPIVLVGSDRSFPSRDSWLDVFTNAQANLLDPLTSSTGAEALLALQNERATTHTTIAQVAEVLVPMAQRHGSMAKPFTDVNGLFSRAAAPGAALVVPATEQAFVSFQDKRPDSGLRALVPTTGTLQLDYPMIVTAKDNAEQIGEAGKRLAQELRSDASARALDAAGFRNITNDPLSGGRGVGDLTLMNKPAADVAQQTLQQWATLALSAHSLAVIDASSSMLTRAGNKTWMDLTTEAAEAGMKLFPDNSQVGLWALSTRLSGPNRDWASLVPIAPLTKAHRQALLTQLHGLKAKIGGSTGLYDAVLASYRLVRDSYDPRSVNAVMIFTDGFSTNVRGLTLDQTLQSLQQLRDPARPVRLITIGMGPNVDTAALDKLAKATGGRSYQAKDPNDIKKVFVDALQSR